MQISEVHEFSPRIIGEESVISKENPLHDIESSESEVKDCVHKHFKSLHIFTKLAIVTSCNLLMQTPSNYSLRKSN